MSDLSSLVFNTTDHFAEAEDNKVQQGTKGGHVHIRVQQRNGRKSLTTIAGLAEDLDLKKILKAMKKKYSTNGTILKDDEVGEVIQLQGDQRKNALDFLVKFKVCEKGQIKVHGF